MQNQTAGKLALRPLGTRIIVRQKAWQNQLASGLFIPDGSRAGYEDVAEILAIGPKVDVETLDIKVGDRVMFRRRPGSAVLPDPREVSAAERAAQKDLLVLEQDDLIAVIDP